METGKAIVCDLGAATDVEKLQSVPEQVHPGHAPVVKISAIAEVQVTQVFQLN